MSERYVPPPPPYELSLQRDQKVAEEVQALEASKESPFRDEEWKDSKALADETLGSIAIHSLSSVPKRPTRLDSTNLRAPRPLPPSPAGNVDTPSLDPRGKSRPVVDTKTYAIQNGHEREPHSPAPPPFSAIESSFGEHSHLQSAFHPSTSVHPFPSHYPSQLSYETPRRNHGNRRPASACSPIQRYAETTVRRSPHVSSESTSYSLPQNKSFETRLPFDPSVAYSDSQANIRTAFSARRGAAASLYRPVFDCEWLMLRPDGHSQFCCIITFASRLCHDPWTTPILCVSISPWFTCF